MASEYKYNRGGTGGDNSELISWLIVVAGLIFFWPVGLFFLYRKLTGNPIGSTSYRTRSRTTQNSQHPYDVQQDKDHQSAQSKTAGEQSTYHAQYEYRYQPKAQESSRQQQPSAAQRGGQSSKSKWQYATIDQRYGGKTAPGMQGVPGDSSRKPVNLNQGRAMTVWGAILTGYFGLGALTTIPLALMEFDLAVFFGSSMPILGFLSLGIVLMALGGQRRKQAKRFRKYLALIGKRSSIAISSLAQAMPVSYQTACADLQEMLDRGVIPTGYLDMSDGRLILSDEGLHEAHVQSEKVEVVEEEEETADNGVLLDEITQVNDAISDPDMSRKIDRIGEITAKILEYQTKNPGKAGQLRSFLSYYLPTTLKILRAYAQMEAQGIEGENIRAAKQRIEGMMDKVVEGFEKQLDKLFQGDAMDITTDVEVLERMLDKDGLSGSNDMFQMGG